MRVFNQLRFGCGIGKRLSQYRFLFSHDAGHIPRDSIYDDHSRNLTARKDEIADRNFRRSEMFDNALVDAFVAAANHDHLEGLREPQCLGLGKALSRSAEYNHFGLFGLSNCLDRFKDRFGLENHSFTAAKRTVINRAVAI